MKNDDWDGKIDNEAHKKRLEKQWQDEKVVLQKFIDRFNPIGFYQHGVGHHYYPKKQSRLWIEAQHERFSVIYSIPRSGDTAVASFWLKSQELGNWKMVTIDLSKLVTPLLKYHFEAHGPARQDGELCLGCYRPLRSAGLPSRYGHGTVCDYASWGPGSCSLREVLEGNFISQRKGQVDSV